MRTSNIVNLNIIGLKEAQQNFYIIYVFVLDQLKSRLTNLS